MKLLEAKKKIQQIQIPLLHTHEAAKILDMSNSQASLILHRLHEAEEVVSLKKGLWLIDKNASSFFIGEHLARPYPAYVSLQSALYLHGMISQIPETIFLVSLARSQKQVVGKTTYSFHHTEITLFTGFQLHEKFNLASPEKLFLIFSIFRRPRKTFLNLYLSWNFPKALRKKIG